MFYWFSTEVEDMLITDLVPTLGIVVFVNLFLNVRKQIFFDILILCGMFCNFLVKGGLVSFS